MLSPFAVLFDMDGVIVDSNPVHKTAIQDFCKKYNKQISDSFLEQHIYGRTNKEWIPAVFPEASDAEVLALSDEKESMFREIFDPQKAVVPGLLPFLDLLSEKKIPMVLATSAPVENADFILNQLSISHHFMAVLTMGDVAIGKPHPDIYIKAAKRAHLPESKCLVIEDSVAGVSAGIRAGCKVIGLTTTHSESELSDCHLIRADFKTISYDGLVDLVSAT